MRQYVVLLQDCQHKIIFTIKPPRSGEIVWCRYCCKERLVITTGDDWSLRCLDCKYSRTYPGGKSFIEDRAWKHINDKGHRVKIFVWSRYKETEEIVIRSDRHLLDDLDVVPPF